MLAVSLVVVAYLPILLAASPATPDTPSLTCSSQFRTTVALPSLPTTSVMLGTIHSDQPRPFASLKEPSPVSTVTTTLTSTYTIPSLTADLPKSTSSYMEIVNQWRMRMHMNALENDPMLETNAMDTLVAANGAMTHKLNPGTLGQVLAPGNLTSFENIFVGGWLCELPDLPGLGDVCARESVGWNYNGQTGHAEILTSDDYARIGCALFANIWCCDLA